MSEWHFRSGKQCSAPMRKVASVSEPRATAMLPKLGRGPVVDASGAPKPPERRNFPRPRRLELCATRCCEDVVGRHGTVLYRLRGFDMCASFHSSSAARRRQRNTENAIYIIMSGVIVRAALPASASLPSKRCCCGRRGIIRRNYSRIIRIIRELFAVSLIRRNYSQ